MRDNGILRQSEKYAAAHKRRRKWLTAVTGMACVVVFCVTYALILPAITMTGGQTLVCPYEVHQHNESCFDADGNVICGYADYVIHTHDPEYCYDSEGNLVCGLTEIKAHEHGVSCYTEERTLTCGQEESSGHEHDVSCYSKVRGELLCGLTEEAHIHTDACYDADGGLICGLTEEGHIHTDECYAWTEELTCGKETGEGAHQHSEDCWEIQKLLTCEEQEAVVHIHSDSCYEGNVAGQRLICGRLQVEEHQHDEACIAEALSDVGNAAAANGMLFSARFGGTCEGISWTLAPAAGGGYRLVLSADTSTAIPSNLFSDETLSAYKSEISAVVIGADITEIGANAFASAEALRSVTFETGSALTTIGAGAFAGCVNLTSANLEDCASLSTIVSGSAPENGAFYGAGLTQVTIPASVTAMGDFAFFGCQNLSSVSFVENPNLTDMGAYVFAQCTALESVSLENLTSDGLIFGTKDSAAIGGTTITNGSGLFYGCTSLRSLTLPNMSGSVAYLCKGCSSLTALSLDNCKKLECDDTTDNVQFLHFIDGCGKLETLDLSGVTGMTTLFSGIVESGVKKVILPPTLTRVAQTAIAWTNVEEVVFTKDSDGNSNLKQIGGTDRNTGSHIQAFASATKLKELNLEFAPDAQQSELFLLTSAFLNCYNLETISISSPAGLQELGDGCFTDCKNLQNLTWDVKKVTTPIAWNYLVNDLSKNIRFTIGPNVEVLPGYLTKSIGNNVAEYIFTPDCSFYVNGTPGGIFTNAAGCYYADANGNLYRLNSDNTAELVYANRSGSGDFTIPETLSAQLCTESGRSGTEETFTVTGVCKDAFTGTGYSSITFDKPENITLLEDSAFAGAFNLASINGQTTEQDIKALFTNSSISFGSDLFVETKITSKPFESGSVTAVYPGEKLIEVVNGLVQIGAASDSKLKAINDAKHFATGETANITVGVSDESSEKKVRIYLKVSDPASFTLPKKLGDAAVQSTSENGVYYYDVPIGGTATHTLGVTCPELAAPGKKAYVWLLEAENENVLTSLGNAVVEPGVTYTPEETSIGTATASSEYFELTWDVLAREYSVIKTANDVITPTVKKAAEDGAPSTVTGLSFIVSNSTAQRQNTNENDTNSYDSIGADYVESVSFTDVLTLPTGLKWKDGLLDSAAFTSAINAGKNGGSITAAINGEVYTLCTLNLTSDSLAALDCKVENGNLVISWTTANGSAEREISPADTTITYGSEVITVDETAAGTTEYSVTNNVTAVPRYTYSGVSSTAKKASVDHTVKTEPSPLTAKKEWVKKPAYIGEEAVYRITLDHVADANADAAVDIYDELGNNQYPASETIEQMLLGSGYDGEYLTITINDAVILKPPETKTVTAVDGETKEQTSVRNTGAASDYAGLAKTYDYNTGTITFVKDSTNNCIKVTAAITGGATTDYSVGSGGLQAKLDEIGYVRSVKDSCVLHWSFPANTVQAADTHKEYELHTVVNNTFQVLEQDHNTSLASDVAGGTYTLPVSNTLRTNIETIQTETAYPTYDLSIDKLAKVGGVPQDTDKLSELMTGDPDFVIDYSLEIKHFGTGTYGLLPVVDHMTGIQALLAEAADNNGAEWINKAEKYTAADGKEYYILNEAGVYNGVWLENGYADSVTVTKGENGLDTLIKWYYIHDEKSEDTLAPAYKAICGTKYAGGTDHGINNEAWVNDIPTRRLHDNIGAEGVSISFQKRIVTEKGTDPDTDTLWDYPTKPYPIEGPGTKVTYRLDLKQVGSRAITLTGADFYDVLPAVGLNSGNPVFVWTNDNVKVSYVTVGEEVKVSDETNAGYEIVRDGSTENYKIIWNDNFSISYPAGTKGEVYVYVELTFPTGEAWEKYLTAKGSTLLYNSLYVHDVASQVSHVLPIPGNAMLRKGVYETGYYVMNQSGNNTAQYFRGADRHHYVKTSADVNAVKNTVTYFVTLYNSSDTANMYLSPIYDQLPEGFEFYSLVSTPVGGNDSTVAYSGSTHLSERGGWGGVIGDVDIVELTHGSSAPLAQPAATDKLIKWWNEHGVNRTVRARSPYNTRTLIFDVVLDENHRDEQGYYLKPGEAIQFGYMCFTGDANVTSADNCCAMEYVDYSGAGVSLTEEAKQAVKVDNTVVSAPENTGEAGLIDNTYAAQLGFAQTNPDNPKWLFSRVSLTEGDIIPGITLKVGSYNVKSDEPVTWTVTSTNSGSNAMRDYTITDTMQSPLGFTGQVGYTIRSSSANAYSYSESLTDNQEVVRADYLFDITSVTEDGVTLVSKKGGDPITVSYGQEQELTVSAKSVSGKTQDTKIVVSFTKTDNDMTMSIRFSDPLWSIPANGESMLTLSTQIPEGTKNADGVYVNNAVITPTQSFDPEKVNQGTVSKDKKSVYTTASVNIYSGILTNAYKEVESGGKRGVSPNYASPTGETFPDSILLNNISDEITYTLNVNGADGSNMQKLVVIDTLPQDGDTNPINDSLHRGSGFKVNFADKDVTVEIVTTVDTTETTETLTSGYTVQYSTAPSGFSKDIDYTGGEDATKIDWVDAADVTNAADYRSIRVIIDRALEENEIARISFKAKIDQDAAGEDAALPGELAWNNFGYSFLTNANMWLYAAPQNVGVALRSAPTIEKTLVRSDGTTVSAPEDTEFRFVVYKGNNDVDFKAYDTQTVGQALSAANKEFTYVAVTVKKDSPSGEFLLDPRTTYNYTYDNANGFTPKTENWTWVDKEQYTVAELDDSGGNGEYKYGYTNEAANIDRTYTFTYDETQNRTVTVYNTRHDWSIELTKTNDQTDKSPLPGAVFGLYSVNENPYIAEEFAKVGLPEDTATTYTADGKTWYLSQAAVTDADGKLTWTGLCEDSYIVLELKAPDGYIPSVTPLTLYYADAKPNGYTVEKTVENTPGCILPDTGGGGSIPYMIGGSLIMLGAGILLLYRHKVTSKNHRLKP